MNATATTGPDPEPAGDVYSAFGLELRCAWGLPGMGPQSRGDLPAVRVELATPRQLAAAWSGGRARFPWRGRLGDGRDLTVEWGVAGDLRFSYGEQAWFLLALAADRLTCAPVAADDLAWQRVLMSRVLPNLSIARGREALHSAAVETPSGVLAIAAPSGTGKSTLVAELLRRGHRFFTDDVLTLDHEDGDIVAHPGTPHLNITGPEASLAGFGKVLGTFAGEHWIAVDRFARGAGPVAAIVLFERRRGLPLALEPVAATPLILAPYMLGLPDEAGRDARHFELYSSLVESACILRLTAGDGHRPAEIADALERALTLEAELSGAGV